MTIDHSSYERAPESRDRFWEPQTARRLVEIEHVRSAEYAPTVRNLEAQREREQSTFAAALGWPDGKCPDDVRTP